MASLFGQGTVAFFITINTSKILESSKDCFIAFGKGRHIRLHSTHSVVGLTSKPLFNDTGGSLTKRL